SWSCFQAALACADCFARFAAWIPAAPTQASATAATIDSAHDHATLRETEPAFLKRTRPSTMTDPPQIRSPAGADYFLERAPKGDGCALSEWILRIKCFCNSQRTLRTSVCSGAASLASRVSCALRSDRIVRDVYVVRVHG